MGWIIGFLMRVCMGRVVILQIMQGIVRIMLIVLVVMEGEGEEGEGGEGGEGRERAVGIEKTIFSHLKKKTACLIIN